MAGSPSALGIQRYVYEFNYLCNGRVRVFLDKYFSVYLVICEVLIDLIILHNISRMSTVTNLPIGWKEYYQDTNRLDLPHCLSHFQKEGFPPGRGSVLQSLPRCRVQWRRFR